MEIDWFNHNDTLLGINYIRGVEEESGDEVELLSIGLLFVTITFVL